MYSNFSKVLLILYTVGSSILGFLICTFVYSSNFVTPKSILSTFVVICRHVHIGKNLESFKYIFMFNKHYDSHLNKVYLTYIFST